MPRSSIVRRSAALLAGAALVASCASTPEPAVVPNANLKVEGIPPIPASLAAKVAPYTEFRPRFLASWHPERHELVVRTRATNTTQLFDVRAPLAAPAQLTDFAEPVRFGAWWPAKPDTLVFVRDSGGNERSQLYRLDPGAKEPVLLTDPARLHQFLTVNRARDRMLIGSTDVDRPGVRRENPTLDVTLLDPLDPASARRIATLPGTGWGDFSYSFDGARLAMTEFRSVTDTTVWVMDLATGERRRVLPGPADDPKRTIASTQLSFSREGKGLFLTTDRDGEFQRAAFLDLSTGRLEAFGPDRWDVEELALSRDGRTLALVVNEAGAGVLRLYDADTRRELPRPDVPIGTVSGVQWHADSTALAFDLDSSRSPGDVYVLELAGNRVARWTDTKVAGLDASRFAVQTPIEWKSFDGRTITGFIARPPAAAATAGPPQGRRAPLGGEASEARIAGPAFAGRRPVMIQIHGGPEGQARPGFLGRWNYYINELGIAIIEPNVRGSTGYGRTFVSLDNGVKREDSVRDIGALLDWIAAQPDLDPSRVVVAGGSYGGYMTLAVATNYADRIAGAIDIVGVANFVTFLERTETYRRDLRRVEYGDERDPAMRAFLEKISPVNNAAKIGKPLFVVHGRNDPRVPYTEAEQIVETVRGHGTPVWYLLAANEGHGFAKKENADFLFYATIRFLQDTVLR
ncbi:MAG: S9 family peptidase [Burkholderiales bacterium]|nr:S9 family peptidase [Burkholderiales bacterium]